MHSDSRIRLMSPAPPRDGPSGRGWLLFVLLVAGYALIGRGTFFTSDEGGIFNTTLALIQRRTLAIGPGENVHPGADGRYYASREILPTLLAVPTAVAGMAVNLALQGRAPPVAPRVKKTDEANWPIFVTITLLGPAAVALTLLLLRRFVLDDTGSGGDALWLMMTAACATPLAVYAKTIFPQVFESAWLMLGFWCALRWRQTGELRHAFGIGTALGLGLMTRAAFLPLVVPFVAYLTLVRTCDLRRRLASLLLLGLPVVAGGAAAALVNWLRWGSPTDFGYHSDTETFSTPALEGLYGLLASPGKGLFVYAPVLLLPLAYLRPLWRRGRAEVLLLLAVTGLYLAVYCRWYDWPGGLAWGPRFLVPLIAPWVAVLGRALSGSPGPWPRRLLAVTLLAGALVQVPGVVLHPKWMFSVGGDAFSFRDPFLVGLARHLLREGPDDLWEFGGGATASTLFWVLVGLSAATAALLWRRTPPGRGRWAVLVLPGFVGVLLCTAFLRP
jgi:hypothetical protein